MADCEKNCPVDAAKEGAALIPRDSRVVTSESLLQGASELQIAHRGDVYRLRLTRSGKLILHK